MFRYVILLILSVRLQVAFACVKFMWLHCRIDAGMPDITVTWLVLWMPLACCRFMPDAVDVNTQAAARKKTGCC